LLVVTLGSAGCVYFTADFGGVVVGFGVEAIDATGAGDGFVAGLLQGLLADQSGLEEEASVRAICRIANAVGALTTTERGAIPALPTRARVDRFLQEQERRGVP
jgi:fructokinase